MSGKRAEPVAKRSSRLAAKEEASVDTRKRGRSSTSGDDKRGNSSPQQPPSKRGRADAAASAAEKAKGSPVPAKSQPAASAASAASPAAPVAPAKQAAAGGTGGTVASAPAAAAPAAAKANPAPASVPSVPPRSSGRNASQGGVPGGVLAAAQARKEASFSTQSIAPEPNPATTTRKGNTSAAAVSASPRLEPVAAKPQQQATPALGQATQPSVQNAAQSQPKQRAQPPMPTPSQAPKASAPQQKAGPSTGTAKDSKPAAVTQRAEQGKLKKKENASGPAAAGAIPKIVIKQGGQAMSSASEKRAVPPVPLTPAQEAATQELRKGLWSVVERWLAARAALAGDGLDRFKSEIKRLCQLLVFDEYKQSQHDVHDCFDEQLCEARDKGSMRCETTSTSYSFRVPANHPRPPPKLLFEATTWIFSADSVMGKTRKGIQDLRWKTEVDLAGVISLSFFSQSMEPCYEEIEAGVLEQLKSTLNTELTVSELGVLLIIAGFCCRGQAAWIDVQDICFWSHNFSLPELQYAQRH